MRLTLRTLPLLCLSIALATASAAAWAQSETPPPPRADPPPQARPMPRNPASLSDSVRRAQRETGGQILGAERVQYDGREINRVKVMDDRGRVRYMDDDPQRRRDPGRQQRERDREEGMPRARGDNPRRP